MSKVFAFVSVSIERDGNTALKFIDVMRGATAEEIALTAMLHLDVGGEDTPGIEYIIQDIDDVCLDLVATPAQISALVNHPGDAVLAALDMYHQDADQAIILLGGGYTIWHDREEVTDNFLEDYDLPVFIMKALEDSEIVWNTAKDGRTLIDVPSGRIVEFHG